MPRRGGDAGKCHHCPPPLVVVVNLGGAHVEAVLRALHQALHKPALVLQTPGPGEVEFRARHTDDDGRPSGAARQGSWAGTCWTS